MADICMYAECRRQFDPWNEPFLKLFKFPRRSPHTDEATFCSLECLLSAIGLEYGRWSLSK